jgi:hypothetical protein
MLRRSTTASAIVLGLSAWIATARAEEEPGAAAPAEIPPAAEAPSAPLVGAPEVEPKKAPESPEAPQLREETEADGPKPRPAQRKAVAEAVEAESEPAAGFRIESSDGNYLMRFALSAGFKCEPAWNDDERTSFGSVRWARPTA